MQEKTEIPDSGIKRGSEEKTGIITKCLGGLYYVRFDDRSEISCNARGVFRYEHQKPVAGDRVVVRGDVSDSAGAFIEQICERKNMFVRPPLANLDIIFVVMAAAKPAPILTTFDKLICMAEYFGIEPVVIITKADVDPDKAAELTDIYSRSGFKVFTTDIESGGCTGLLREFIVNEAKDSISCFAGASGVGKSTLMTSLFPSLDLKTGEVSRKISRGKQTTRHVELYPVCELISEADRDCLGYIADTPGFSLLDFLRLDFFTKEDLPLTFREFEPYIGKCRYTRCTHLREEGCAIVEAVEKGIIPKQRHDSFVEIYGELKNKHEWDRKNR